MTALAILVLIALALFGLPLYMVIGGLALLFSLDNPLASFFYEGYSQLVSSPNLISIPLFTLTGYLMAESKTGERMVRLFNGVFGWLPGGLTIQVVVVCSFFTIFTGASGVTIIAVGTLLYPVLLKANYPEEYALGVLTASGSLGLLLPPSLPLILYGVIAKTDIKALFWAGIIPGIILIVVLALHGMYISIKAETPRTPFDIKEAMVAMWEAKWEVALPFLVLGLYFSGVISLPEAPIITAVYILIVEVFIYRDLGIIEDLPRISATAMKMVGAITVILLVALVLGGIANEHKVPDLLFKAIQPYMSHQWQFLLALNFFLLLVGCLLDIFSAILIVVPLIVPLAAKFNVDPVHLGIIFLANLELGYMTPPVGMNLFIASFTFKQPVLKLYRVTLPFLGLLALALLLITYVPALSLWLPTATGAYKAQTFDKKPGTTGKPGARPSMPSTPIKLLKPPSDAGDDDDDGADDDDDDMSLDGLGLGGDKKDKKPKKPKEPKSPDKRESPSGQAPKRRAP